MIKIVTNIVKGALRKPLSKRSHVAKIGWLRSKWIKHQDDQKVKEMRLENLTVFYRRPYELLHSYGEIFGNEIYKFTGRDESPFVIDCGSNIGLSILYFKKIYPRANIIAFEPDANNFNLLKRNIEENGLEHVELNQAAVWISDGEISFDSKQSEASHISMGSTGQTVKSVRLKSLLSAAEAVDFLKIDIEGAEAHVVEDIAEELAKVRNLFLEYHGTAEESPKLARIVDIIAAKGFKLYCRNAADNLRLPFVEKRTGTSFDVQLNLFCYR